MFGRSVCITALVLGSVAAANADLIDFEAQGAAAPSAFNGTLNSPLVIGIATFTGGQLLNHEAGGVDQTAIYGTTSFSIPSGAYTDPVVINFSQSIKGFSIDVTNDSIDTYTVTDNLGGSQSFTLPTNNITHTFSLSDSGITSVRVSSAGKAFWDFAIDNVQFTPATSTVPEPSAVLLLASALGVIVTFARRKAF
jgi:hypothetical protein